MITLSLSSLSSIYLSVLLSITYLSLSLSVLLFYFKQSGKKQFLFSSSKQIPQVVFLKKRFLAFTPLLIKQVTIHQFLLYHIFDSSCSVPPHCFFTCNKKCLCKLKNKIPLSVQHFFHYSIENLLLRACLLPLLQNGRPHIPFTSFPSACHQASASIILLKLLSKRLFASQLNSNRISLSFILLDYLTSNIFLKIKVQLIHNI